MLFKYTAVGKTGVAQDGSIEAINVDVAISSLQRRDLVISSIHPVDDPNHFAAKYLSFLNRVKIRDVVMLSQQISTLFEAQVSALKVFRLLASETESQALSSILNQVADDLQAGTSISKAMAKHPKVFSPFYVSMVVSGEETGHLDEVFIFLAEYLDRTYAMNSKARNALIYPAFVVVTFIAVMVLMLTMVIPKISDILLSSGQEIPLYTRVVLGFSSFFTNYGIFLLAAVVVGVFFLFRYVRTKGGRSAMDHFKIAIPFIGDFYKKLYLARIADNWSTSLASGITMVRSLELSSSVVDNVVYKAILEETVISVKGGASVSDSLSKYPEIPGIIVQMIKVGEETGELGSILKTMAKFYQREVNAAIETLISLIEPVMIVFLGLAVGVLLASVLIPIYNVASSV
jgi:type IV pilus assembly protein PilC